MTVRDVPIGPLAKPGPPEGPRIGLVVPATDEVSEAAFAEMLAGHPVSVVTSRVAFQNPVVMATLSRMVAHGSAPNRSATTRVAILHDFTPAAARQSVGRNSHQLVRGRDVFGHFAHEPVPTPDFEANVRTRRRILSEYPENILMSPLEHGATPDFPDRRDVPA